MLGLTSFFKDDNERELIRLSRIVERIDALEPELSGQDDRLLRAKTGHFRHRLAQQESLDSLLPEAFAVVREAARRVLGMRHFGVQLLGGIALHEGSIIEMKTGEGKTLAGTLPVYLNALTGQGVHVITVNEYLAQRDSQLMGQIFRFLGLTVGCTLHGMSRGQKKQAYACDIIYGTCSEFGFDYLRDNLVLFPEQEVQRTPWYALIDEVDSILIDEARTPLVISSRAQRANQLYQKADRFAALLKDRRDFQYDPKNRSIVLTETSVKKAEKEFGIDNLFALEHMLINHHLNQALRARHVLKRDVDYVVKDSQIVIVDEFTGRLMEGRRYSDGLHQAIEAKEKLDVGSESVTQAAITLQSYFRIYPKLGGMTGTARTELGEFKYLYGLNVVEIPANHPPLRKDIPDMVFMDEAAKYKAVAEEIAARHQTGQPVLVGTVSIENSQRIAAELADRGITHRVLNAHHHAEEAEIIRQAGQLGAVTISTNMAGRGTDIMLGAGVAELGGLHVLGTERHESRRIDNQLRGRAGRQGDPGSSQFFMSMEDVLMRRFGAEALTAKLVKLGLGGNVPLAGSMISRSVESAQTIVEGGNFDSLLMLLQYDEVINRQRVCIYRDRRYVLYADNIRPVVLEMIRSVVERTVEHCCPEHEVPENWQLPDMVEYLNSTLMPEEGFAARELWGKEKPAIIREVMGKLEQIYDRREEQIGGTAMRRLEKYLVLRSADAKWMEHIEAMDQLRQGINLRSYAGNDPLEEYQMEGHTIYLQMIGRIQEEVSSQIMKVRIADGVRPEAAV